jgi:outer membrane lipoprotein-sorting protein
MSDVVTDLKQISISRVTLSLILSVAMIAAVITWNSARLVARIDQLEAAVESIEGSMEMNGYARSVHVDELAVRLEELTGSVAYLLERDHAG